ncbi:hypothetical protein MVEN_00716000 [Mycena venus]|uniref:Uncharacterized protein n=1 Tax=Mycena venus TaxID=2733690 RepID=A0A8H6YHK0_9AGAR|nr:hypothetical protein MVEN_00716000 [Mycena venus]
MLLSITPQVALSRHLPSSSPRLPRVLPPPASSRWLKAAFHCNSRDLACNRLTQRRIKAPTASKRRHLQVSSPLRSSHYKTLVQQDFNIIQATPDPNFLKAPLKFIASKLFICKLSALGLKISKRSMSGPSCAPSQPDPFPPTAPALCVLSSKVSASILGCTTRASEPQLLSTPLCPTGADLMVNSGGILIS